MNEKEKDMWYALGHIAQLEIEARSLRERAGKLYTISADDFLASELRAMSIEMLLRAKHMRQDYDIKYPK